MPDEQPATNPQPPDPYDLGDTSLTHTAELPDRDAQGRFLPKPAVPATPAAPVTAARPAHPDYLIEQARFFGFSDDDLANMDSAALGRAVSVSLRQYHASQSQLAQQRERLGHEVQKPPPEAEPVDEWGALEKEIDTYDPAAAKLLKQIARRAFDAEKRAKDSAESFQKELKERDEAQSKKAINNSAQLLDAAFARLAEKDARYKALFGEGSARNLNPQSHEMKRRRLAMQEAGVDLKDVNGHTIVRQLQGAADVVWPVAAAPVEPPPAANPYDRPTEPAPIPAPASQRTYTPDQWDRAGLARPSQRNGAAEPDGKAKAVQNLRERMREAGQLTEQSDPDILDGLL